MFNYTLFQLDKNKDEFVKMADMLFDNHYEAFDFLRQLSYTYQAAGAKTHTIPGEEIHLAVRFNNGKVIAAFRLIEQK